MSLEHLSRSEMLLIKKAAKEGWPVATEKRLENIARLQAVIDDHDRNDRDRQKARETLDAVEASDGVQSNAK